MKIDKAAFPSHANEGWSGSGMTLRDYFAGQALAGLCVLGDRSSFRDVDGHEELFARLSYQLADAMLKAREE
jgi:hypothetical protein